MARKKDAVDVPRSPKAPWESYDPLSIEVYGEPFEVQLSPEPKGAGEDTELPDAQVEISGAVEAPPEVQVEASDEIPVATGDGAAPEAEPVMKEMGKRRSASQPEKVMESTKVTRRRVVRRKKMEK